MIYRKFKQIVAVILFTAMFAGGPAFGLEINWSAPTEDVDVFYRTEGDADDTWKLSMSSNQLIDAYIIASAVYMDFNSDVLLPDSEEHAVYKKAKTYFTPYRGLNLFKGFEKYVNGNDVNGDAVAVLLAYADSEKEDHEWVEQVDSKYRQGIFKEDASVIEFVDMMLSFYKVTNAEGFFEDNEILFNTVSDFVNNKAKSSKLNELMETLNSYVGVDTEISYKVVLTVFRPSTASYYSYKTGETQSVISFQSPNDRTLNPYKLDFDVLTETMIHEFLHFHVNVGSQSALHDLKSKGYSFKDKLVAKGMYSEMPLETQLNEYLVRAVEARIYKAVYGEIYTFSNLMEKEINFGGFDRLLTVYDAFSKYESNRGKYPTLEDYLPEVVKIFSK